MAKAGEVAAMRDLLKRARYWINTYGIIARVPEQDRPLLPEIDAMLAKGAD